VDHEAAAAEAGALGGLQRTTSVAFRISPDLLDELHRRSASSTLAWELQAVTLRYAVEVLFRQVRADLAGGLRHRTRKSVRPSLHGPALMLAGMMLEALAKAILIERGKSITDHSLQRHELVTIVAATGYSPNADDTDLLRRLSAFLRWAGRYPAPKKSTEMAVETSDGGRHLAGGSVVGADLVAVRRLADELESLLPGGRRLRLGMWLPTGRATAGRTRSKARKTRSRLTGA
jgi:hypothetical protein